MVRTSIWLHMRGLLQSGAIITLTFRVAVSGLFYLFLLGPTGCMQSLRTGFLMLWPGGVVPISFYEMCTYYRQDCRICGLNAGCYWILFGSRILG